MEARSSASELADTTLSSGIVFRFNRNCQSGVVEDQTMLKNERGCYCGSLRYAVAGDPLNTAICHCKSCQRQTGSAYSVIIAVPRGSLSMDGSVATYEITGDNGAVSRPIFLREMRFADSH